MTLLERARSGQPLADLNIIDMHGHLGRYYFAIPDISPDGLVAAMDCIGISKILCSHFSSISGECAMGNSDVLAAIRAWPGRIEGYITVWPSSAEDVAAETDRCLTAGFIGLKLHNNNEFPYTDPAYAPALARANERCMPVLLHTWGKEQEFQELRQLSQAYPDISILAAHAGSAREDDYARIARDCENVYLDTPASWAPRGLIDRLVEKAGAHRVVFGSDAVFLSMTQQIGRVLGACVSDEDKLAVLSKNAARILGRVQR